MPISGCLCRNRPLEDGTPKLVGDEVRDAFAVLEGAGDAEERRGGQDDAIAFLYWDSDESVYETEFIFHRKEGDAFGSPWLLSADDNTDVADLAAVPGCSNFSRIG